jgi:hypothetical protein
MTKYDKGKGNDNDKCHDKSKARARRSHDKDEGKDNGTIKTTQTQHRTNTGQMQDLILDCSGLMMKPHAGVCMLSPLTARQP